jgi:hypothetical protein
MTVTPAREPWLHRHGLLSDTFDARDCRRTRDNKTASGA